MAIVPEQKGHDLLAGAGTQLAIKRQGVFPLQADVFAGLSSC